MDYYNFENEFTRGYPMGPMINPQMMNINQMQEMGGFTNNSNTPWPLDFMSKSSNALLVDLANGLKDAVLDEKHDELFYERLMKIAPEEDKKIIQSIADDEKIHNKIFRKAYLMITGIPLPINVDENVKIDMSSNYLEMLESALMGELNAVKEYRKLTAYAPSKDISNMIMYPLTDEIRHANLYNYLIARSLHSK